MSGRNPAPSHGPEVRENRSRTAFRDGSRPRMSLLPRAKGPCSTSTPCRTRLRPSPAPTTDPSRADLRNRRTGRSSIACSAGGPPALHGMTMRPSNSLRSGGPEAGDHRCRETGAHLEYTMASSSSIPAAASTVHLGGTLEDRKFFYAVNAEESPWHAQTQAAAGSK